MNDKVTGQLRDHLGKGDSSQMVEVVIELPSSDDTPTKTAQSRSERIASLKANFSRDSAAIQEAVRNVGGEVTGESWLNRTLRARVPSDSVNELSKYESVARIDAPHKLEPDYG